MAKANSERPQGSLPSNTEANSREHLKAISLRSGKLVETKAEKSPSVEENKVVLQEVLENLKS